ncbi:hypothetical protein P7C71_g1549, partial [Lecanoromycetidae sp. Uapishka_2]
MPGQPNSERKAKSSSTEALGSAGRLKPSGSTPSHSTNVSQPTRHGGSITSAANLKSKPSLDGEQSLPSRIGGSPASIANPRSSRPSSSPAPQGQKAELAKTLNVQTLIELLGISGWQSLEKVLHNLRVKTVYIKDSATGESKIKLLTVKRLGRPLKLNSDGTPDLKDQKLQFGDGAKRGNAEHLIFKSKSGDQSSVAQYFYQHYNVILNSSSWILDCGSNSKTTWIPAEMAFVRPEHVLHRDIAAKLIAAKPIGKYKLLPQLGTFGVTMVPQKQQERLTIDGCVLENPTIQYQNTKAEPTINAAWNMVAKWGSADRIPMSREVHTGPRSPLEWIVLNLGSASSLPDHSETLSKALNRFGVAIPKSRHDPQTVKSTGEDFDTDLGAKFASFKERNIPMVFVILPSEKAIAYERVKYWADYKHGIHTICLQSKNLEEHGKALASLTKSTKEWNAKQKASLRFFAGIALKYNVKAGGINHKPSTTLLHTPKYRDTLFIGINTMTMPSNSHTIASVVGNVDSGFDKWPGSLRCQKGSVDSVEELMEMVKEQLQRYTSKDPSHIVVYRRGVSDSQYQKVLDEEFPKILRARDSYYTGNKKPKLTMIIASSSHKRQFDPEGNGRAAVHREAHRKAIEDGKKPEGTKISKVATKVKPGAVIERTGQIKGAWDFFLQSHFAPNGTAKPTHYIVIKEEKEEQPRSPREIQALTNDLCYFSASSTRATSLCAPLHYAELLGKHGQWSLQEQIVPNFDPDDKAKFRVADGWKGLKAEHDRTMFYV